MASWKKHKQRLETLDFNFLSLKTEDLCHPQFSLDPEKPMAPPGDLRFRLVSMYSKLSDPPTTEEVTLFLKETYSSKIPFLFPEFDLADSLRFHVILCL